MFIDFEYDGEKLSDYGMSVMYFSEPSQEMNIANEINNSDVYAPGTFERLPVKLSYDGVFELEFSIGNFTCNTIDDIDGMGEEKINKIMRWLNRRDYLKFKPIFQDESFSDCYYKGFFNIELVNIAGMTVGMNLKLITNAPYGYKEFKPITFSTENAYDYYKDKLDSIMAKINSLILEDPSEEQDRELGLLQAEYDKYEYYYTQGILEFDDISDEEGHIYADLTIKCLESGDYVITNEYDQSNIIEIKNCKPNEIIVLHGKQKIIESKATHEKLQNDFNFSFFRVRNDYRNMANVIKVNHKAELSIDYEPIRKVGVAL